MLQRSHISYSSLYADARAVSDPVQRECKLCLRLQVKPALQLSVTAWTAFMWVPKLERWGLAEDRSNNECSVWEG